MNRARRAFTLLELLLSLAIIALLIGIVAVSLRGVRAAANRTESLNGLRNMLRGYVTYYGDHGGHLLPGYLDEDGLAQLDVNVLGPAGVQLTTCDGDGRCDGSSYVWRLLPYLDDNWRTLCIDYSTAAVTAKMQEKLSAGVFGPGTRDPDNFALGLNPAYGLNSIFLGGDTFHGSAATIARNPYTIPTPADPVGVTNVGKVRNPSRILVFAATMQALESDLMPVATGSTALPDVTFGYSQLRPPALGQERDATGQMTLLDRQWEIDPEGQIVGLPDAMFDKGAGVPVDRRGTDDIPSGHLDGSTEVINRYELATDLSWWSPFVTGIGR